MAATTGPVLAIGAITMINQSVFHDKPTDWRVPIATGIAAGGLAVVEKAQPRAAAMLAWAALVTILLTRVGGVESPAESFLSWWDGGGGKGGTPKPRA